MKRTPVLLLFSLGFYVKLYEGTINLQYIFLKFTWRSRILTSFMISNLRVLKWRPFQYNSKFGKKAIFFKVLTKLLLKTLWKSYLFLIHISKVHISICNIEELRDLEISTTKMTVFSIYYKIRNEDFFYNYFNVAFVKTFGIKLLLFNTKFWNSCQDLVFYQVLRHQIFW